MLRRASPDPHLHFRMGTHAGLRSGPTLRSQGLGHPWGHCSLPPRWLRPSGPLGQCSGPAFCREPLLPLLRAWPVFCVASCFFPVVPTDCGLSEGYTIDLISTHRPGKQQELHICLWSESPAKAAPLGAEHRGRERGKGDFGAVDEFRGRRSNQLRRGSCVRTRRGETEETLAISAPASCSGCAPPGKPVAPASVVL